jgi:hypothetical protein
VPDLNARMTKRMAGGVSAEGFRGEYWRVGCEERIRLSGEEWREARSQPDRFAVAPEHVAPDLEAVVQEFRTSGWSRSGEAGEVAKKLA